MLLQGEDLQHLRWILRMNLLLLLWRIVVLARIKLMGGRGRSGALLLLLLEILLIYLLLFW